jgi:DNA repair ATPase RecN
MVDIAPEKLLPLLEAIARKSKQIDSLLDERDALRKRVAELEARLRDAAKGLLVYRDETKRKARREALIEAADIKFGEASVELVVTSMGEGMTEPVLEQMRVLIERAVAWSVKDYAKAIRELAEREPKCG